MKTNTNSNSYTIIYSIIIVVIVAFLLAFVSQALKEKQDANVALDQKKQIFYALNERSLSDSEYETRYAANVKEAEVDGKPIYECKTEDGKLNYVIPMKGMGLWGPIYGYVAISEDKSTVVGAYFNHDSETAGLGAEIKDSQAWQEKFQGKKIFKEGSDEIALGVVKKVENTASEVDAVTGATLTSNGVSDMLKKSLAEYVKFLKAQ